VDIIKSPGTKRSPGSKIGKFPGTRSCAVNPSPSRRKGKLAGSFSLSDKGGPGRIGENHAGTDEGGDEKNLIFVAILLATLLPPYAAQAAVLSWVLPTSYTSGAPIAETDRARIVVKMFTGPSATGPWTLAVTTSPGATSATGPDPLPGETLWYTLTTTLDGMESDFAQPVSKTAPAEPPPPAPKIPAAPGGLRISLPLLPDRGWGHG
jgi:hypothetical protein